jgi:hypothetical protein
MFIHIVIIKLEIVSNLTEFILPDHRSPSLHPPQSYHIYISNHSFEIDLAQQFNQFKTLITRIKNSSIKTILFFLKKNLKLINPQLLLSFLTMF